jgi:hypothetical protein
VDGCRTQCSATCIPSAFSPRTNRRSAPEENRMRDVIFILLTLAIFAVFALIVRGVERM